MEWEVEFHPAFEAEVLTFERVFRVALIADTLKGSKHANMKARRFEGSDGEWRAAFDPERKAIVLVAGDKSGVSQKRFYKTLIAKADLRFSRASGKPEIRKEGKMRWVGA